MKAKPLKASLATGITLTRFNNATAPAPSGPRFIQTAGAIRGGGRSSWVMKRLITMAKRAR